jgi:hypothetical protein
MNDTLKMLEWVKLIAKKEFPEDYSYSSESRQMAIRNVLIAVQACNDSPSNVMYDLESAANMITAATEPKPQDKQPEKPRTTELVRG